MNIDKRSGLLSDGNLHPRVSLRNCIRHAKDDFEATYVERCIHWHT